MHSLLMVYACENVLNPVLGNEQLAFHRATASVKRHSVAGKTQIISISCLSVTRNGQKLECIIYTQIPALHPPGTE